MDGIRSIFREASIPVCMNGYPAMFSFAVGPEQVTGQRDWNESDKAYYLKLVEAVIEHGVMPDHDPATLVYVLYAWRTGNWRDS